MRVWVRFLRGLGSLAAWLAVLAIIGVLQRKFQVHGSWVAVADAALMLAAYWACSRFIERRDPVEIGASGAASEWLAGAALGLLIFAVTIGILAVGGWYAVIAPAWSAQAFATGIAMCVATGILEETLVRGYVFRFAQSSLGTWLAIALSALLFGFLHIFNPGATLWTSTAIAIEAGILLAAAFALTGRLWLAMGIHTAWNFAEGTIFGTIVSGTTSIPSVVKARLTGPEIVTGGSFGPEGSIITVLVCVALSTYFLVRMIRAGKVVPPPWTIRATAVAPILP